MSNWFKSTKVVYEQWRDPQISVVSFQGEGDIVGCNDEDQCTDYEICTSATSATDSGKHKSSLHESNKPKETFTVEDAVEALGFGKFQIKLSILTGLSWMGDSMEMMLLSMLGPALHCEWRISGFQVAFLTSAVFIGMGISSSLWGNASDKYGRKMGLIMAMVWTLYYSFLSAFAPVYSWILVLRGLVGVGIGGIPQSVTLYSEFLPKKTRATCIMLIAIFWAIGAVFEVGLAMLVMPSLGWRWLLGLSTLPMFIFVSFSYWLPESAHFDLLAGNKDKAIATLSRIAADNGQTMPTVILTATKKERGRIQDLLTPRYRKTTLILWAIWFGNAFSYYGIILLTTELFQAGVVCGAQGAKIEPSCSLECQYLTFADYKDLLWTTLAEFPGLFITLLVVDRLGRKKSMALCFIMFSLSTLPLFACIGRITVIIFIFIARAFISGGYQVAFVYTPEVFPTETRALGMGTCSGMARLGALITPFVAQVLLRTSFYLTLSVYCGCGLLAAVACMCLPIETTGKGLEESTVVPEQQMTSISQQTNGTTLTPHYIYGSTVH